MKPHLFVLILFMIPFNFIGQTPAPTPAQFKEDFNVFWTSINDEYCYFNKKQTDWEKVKEMYSAVVDSIKTRDQFVSVLEKMLYELYDHHAGLNTNTSTSQRLVPSGTDIWAEYINGVPVITELRPKFGCESAGIIPGMELVAVNDVPVQTAINPFLPKSLHKDDIEARNYALRVLLAGNHIQPRKFTLKYKGKSNDYFPDRSGFLLEDIKYNSRIDTRIMDSIGYIKINNCLYDNDLIPEFDSVMQTMEHTRGLILDLRETGSGGNTSVARAILGWFINKEHFYQKHEYFAEEKESGIKRSWEEIVSPRKGKYYDKPLVILVDHWTGSIAEGITIGFDALTRPRTKIIGTKMARLNGAVYTHELPNTKIHFSFPAERLYHINGVPREQYLPPIYIDLLKEKVSPGEDLFILKAKQYLKGL